MGLIIDKNKKVIGCTYEEGQTVVVIPPGVTAIHDRAFENCFWLRHVFMPDSVGVISTEAFAGCSALVSVRLSQGLQILGASAFHGCASLKRIEIPDSLTFVSQSAFEDCTSLSEAEFPEGMSAIGNRAFCGCTSLTSVTLPAGLRTLGHEAFRGCEQLMDVDIPETVQVLGDYIFEDTAWLYSGFEWKIIGSFLLRYHGSEEYVTVPEGIKVICASAFQDCWVTASVELPDSVIAIRESAFAYCRALRDVNIPPKVDRISRWAFLECSALEEIYLPGRVSIIDEGAFMDCTSLSQVHMSPELTDIAPDAFSGTPMDTASGEFYRVDGVLMEYRGSETCVEVPEGITAIASCAFMEMPVESVVLPDSLLYIFDRAFYNCTGLAYLNIPEGIRYIGEYAFGGTMLSREILPKGFRPEEELFSRDPSEWTADVPQQPWTIFPNDGDDDSGEESDNE